MALVLLALAIADWSLGYALEIAGADLPTKIFWGKSQYIGIVTVPLLWIIFAYSYSTKGTRMTRRTVSLLSILPLITLILALTTETHHLIWTDIRIRTLAPLGARRNPRLVLDLLELLQYSTGGGNILYFSILQSNERPVSQAEHDPADRCPNALAWKCALCIRLISYPQSGSHAVCFTITSSFSRGEFSLQIVIPACGVTLWRENAGWNDRAGCTGKYCGHEPCRAKGTGSFGFAGDWPARKRPV
jgi:hypothetical protein